MIFVKFDLNNEVRLEDNRWIDNRRIDDRLRNVSI
ncbi:hypothetical protein M2372_000570 [Chryseobacterium sp. BIGb0232]|nr:hypothetical protein [Chryseobacterium sp. BIGb0232]ROS20000.1 hypothetical protein EDF65_0701 [Chryseobacterium nakagawai]